MCASVVGAVLDRLAALGAASLRAAGDDLTATLAALHRGARFTVRVL